VNFSAFDGLLPVRQDKRQKSSRIILKEAYENITA
jgi:hypothetical protein